MTLYQPYNDPIWTATHRNTLHIECHKDTPENLLCFLEIQKKFTVDDVEKGCRSYGLRPSSWEYMWKYLRTQMMDMFTVSGASLSVLDPRFFSANRTPVKLSPDWRWHPGNCYPRELFYVEDNWDQGWSMDWPITVSVVLLTLELNPPRVLRFGKACNEVYKWIVNKGTRPDMKFPSTTIIGTAMAQIQNTVLLEELGE